MSILSTNIFNILENIIDDDNNDDKIIDNNINIINVTNTVDNNTNNDNNDIKECKKIAVAINNCYGGFSLSEKAENYLRTHFEVDCIHSLERHDTRLIKTIRKYKSKADGKYAKIEIEYIPEIYIEYYNIRIFTVTVFKLYLEKEIKFLFFTFLKQA